MREMSHLIQTEPRALQNRRSGINAVINEYWRKKPPEQMNMLRKPEQNYFNEQPVERVSNQENQPFAGVLRKPPVTPPSTRRQYLASHRASPPYSVHALRIGRQIWNWSSHIYWHLLLQITGKQTYCLTHICISTKSSVWVGTSWFSSVLCRVTCLSKFPCVEAAKLMKTPLSDQRQQPHQERL